MADHPYFKKKPVKKNPQKVDENGNELFWDGFQWVPRQAQQNSYEDPQLVDLP